MAWGLIRLRLNHRCRICAPHRDRPWLFRRRKTVCNPRHGCTPLWLRRTPHHVIIHLNPWWTPVPRFSKKADGSTTALVEVSSRAALVFASFPFPNLGIAMVSRVPLPPAWRLRATQNDPSTVAQSYPAGAPKRRTRIAGWFDQPVRNLLGSPGLGHRVEPVRLKSPSLIHSVYTELKISHSSR